MRRNRILFFLQHTNIHVLYITLTTLILEQFVFRKITEEFTHFSTTEVFLWSLLPLAVLFSPTILEEYFHHKSRDHDGAWCYPLANYFLIITLSSISTLIFLFSKS